MPKRPALSYAIAIILAQVAWVVASGAGASRPPAAQSSGRDARFFTVGSQSCKTCHRDIFRSWAERPHANAADSLNAEQAADPECQACHMPVLEVESGVGCEACHGPGSAYSNLAVMIDPLKRASAGLHDAAEGCRDCHNPGHPFHVERDLDAEARRVHPGPALRLTIH